MSNPITIDIDQGNDAVNKCIPSLSGATAETFDHSNNSKAFSSLLFDVQNEGTCNHHYR